MLSFSSAFVSPFARANSLHGSAPQRSWSCGDAGQCNDVVTALPTEAPRAVKASPEPHVPAAPSRFHVVQEGSKAVDVPLLPPKVKQAYEHEVFVYGSLLPGLGNHGLLKNSRFMGYHKTEPEYDMYSLIGFPAVCNGGDTPIVGALYRVDEATLDSLDRLEWHPTWYERKRVNLATSGAHPWMYLMPRDSSDIRGDLPHLVPGGDWYAHQRPGTARPTPTVRVPPAPPSPPSQNNEWMGLEQLLSLSVAG